MKANSLIEVLVASHLTAFVDDDKFPERGGIMLIAPPGNMKSTFIKECYSPYKPYAILLSDINVEALGRIKDHISQGHIQTLALPALEKIYERNPQTASNVEGHLKALVDEGFSQMSFQDHRMLGQLSARCLVVGGIVQICYQKNFTRWEDNGFTRRFVWSSFSLSDQNILIQAIHNWKRIEFETQIPMMPQKRIPMTCTAEESNEIRQIMSQQGCEATPYALMKKILSVLKWKFRHNGERKVPMEIIRDFGTSLGQKMAKLEL